MSDTTPKEKRQKLFKLLCDKKNTYLASLIVTLMTLDEISEFLEDEERLND